MQKMSNTYLSNPRDNILPLNPDLSDFELARDFTAEFAKRMPFDSSKQEPWTHAQINRVLLENYKRAFDPNIPRDVQDLFVYLIRNRTKTALTRFRMEQMEQELKEIKQAEEKLIENGWMT